MHRVLMITALCLVFLNLNCAALKGQEGGESSSVRAKEVTSASVDEISRMFSESFAPYESVIIGAEASRAKATGFIPKNEIEKHIFENCVQIWVQSGSTILIDTIEALPGKTCSIRLRRESAYQGRSSFYFEVIDEEWKSKFPIFKLVSKPEISDTNPAISLPASTNFTPGVLERAWKGRYVTEFELSTRLGPMIFRQSSHDIGVTYANGTALHRLDVRTVMQAGTYHTFVQDEEFIGNLENTTETPILKKRNYFVDGDLVSANFYENHTLPHPMMYGLTVGGYF